MGLFFTTFFNFQAGPEMKAKLLSGLGLKGYLVTDGKNPINLFNTANGRKSNNFVIKSHFSLHNT